MPEISEEELKKYQDAQANAEALLASKKRLEEENSKYKTRAKTAEEKLSDSEKAKLQAEGKTNELLELERKKNLELVNKIDAGNKRTLATNIRTEVSKFAGDAHDLDMILKVTEHKNLLVPNEETLEVSGAEDFVSKVRETHSYLFGKKKMPDYNNQRQSGNDDDNQNDGDKSVDEQYKEALSRVTSAKELSEVRKKFGKDLDSYHTNK